MKAYFHHVGQKGAKEDFLKTIYSDVSIELVERSLPDSHASKQIILHTLYQQFPTGLFNCWGVPTGAKSVIKSLSSGDVVLLIESTAGLGSIPVLCQVKSYWNVALHELSHSLWGSGKFPFIFYFKTKIIDLTWHQFRLDIGYLENFRPSGNFYSIRDDRLDRFGGPAGYANHLLQKQPESPGKHEIKERNADFEVLDKSPESSDILDELEASQKDYQNLPKTEREAIIKSRIGQGQFRQKLLDFWKGCAVTSCDEVMILRASHIKPWRHCNNTERLDPYNGLLLLPNLDMLFDLGLISFTDEGTILISMHLNQQTLEKAGVHGDMCLRQVEEPHWKYLRFHRNQIFLP